MQRYSDVYRVGFLKNIQIKTKTNEHPQQCSRALESPLRAPKSTWHTIKAIKASCAIRYEQFTVHTIRPVTISKNELFLALIPEHQCTLDPLDKTRNTPVTEISSEKSGIIKFRAQQSQKRW